MRTSKSSRGLLGAGLVVLTAAAMTGCGGNDPGTLVQNWTIADGTDPASCARTRASQMRFVVFDDNGFVEATEFSPCTDFRNQLTLDEGDYSATATFLDVNNVIVSKTLVIGRFRVTEDQTTTVTVPFTLSDFL